jgi:hypothetical protein
MHAYAGMVKIKSDKLRIADVRLSELALFIELIVVAFRCGEGSRRTG